MSPEILKEHRRIWSQKPTLRRVYQRYFQDIMQRTSPHRPIVEIGSGPGFFKEFFPELIATDLEPSPWVDQVADGCDLPFDSASVGNLVLVDVFHHFLRPEAFLKEASRVLKDGGRVVMLEPWTSLLGYHFYRHVHHERADRNVDPVRPFAGFKDAFDGNAALPALYFSTPGTGLPRGHLEGRLHLVAVDRLPAIGWLLSGGFKPYGLLPQRLLPLAYAADRVLTHFGRLVSLRALITLQRPESN